MSALTTSIQHYIGGYIQGDLGEKKSHPVWKGRSKTICVQMTSSYVSTEFIKTLTELMKSSARLQDTR